MGGPQPGPTRTAREIDEHVTLGELECVEHALGLGQREEPDVGELDRKLPAVGGLPPDATERLALR